MRLNLISTCNIEETFSFEMLLICHQYEPIYSHIINMLNKASDKLINGHCHVHIPWVTENNKQKPYSHSSHLKKKKKNHCK